LLVALIAAMPAMGQGGGAAFEAELCDPCVPPAVREKSVRLAPQTQGASLQAQVQEKLRKRFLAAAGPDGTLTREQARAAGLGAIAQQFDAIDRSGRGAVRFEDYLRHLETRNPRPR
jgi:hypothetical protein